MTSQVRRARDAGDAEAEARLSASLSRLLAMRGIETREMLAYAERAFTRGADAALAGELSAWWAGVGEPARAASLLQRIQARTPLDDRGAILTRIGVLLSRAGNGVEAAKVFESAAAANPDDALPLELLGTLAGWGAIPGKRAARAFLEAADRRSREGDETAAFENCIRAFEAAPTDAVAADRLAGALRDRGRLGAAEEVLLDQARSGSAALRAAIHQRRFQSLLDASDLDGALGAGLDASLDAALDPDRLAQLLAGTPPDRPVDFESLLLRIGREQPLIAEWLLVAIEVALPSWGIAAVRDLRHRAAASLLGDASRGALPDAILSGEGTIARRLSELRDELGRAQAPAERMPRVLEVARLEAARGRYADAAEAIEPFVELGQVQAACLAALLAVRTDHSALRAKALVTLADGLAGRLRAMLASVAAELFVDIHDYARARRATTLAVEADSTCQRAVAARALVAQRDPDGSSAALVERSLAVILPRGKACQVLAESSERRGAARLALTWTQRHLSLRPGDPVVARELLRRAILAEDGERLADAVGWLLSQPIPVEELGPQVAGSLRALLSLSPERVTDVARRALDTLGPRQPEVRDAMLEVARRLDDATLEAQVLERTLVTARSTERSSLLLQIAQCRTRAGDATSAARALRRALGTGADPDDVRAVLSGLPDDDSSDALLARLEIESELANQMGAPPLETAERYRELGAARWDLVDDSRGALVAWTRASEQDPERGLERLAADLRLFAGADGASIELERAAHLMGDPKKRGKLLGFAARAAVEAHLPSEAFRLSCAALNADPTHTDLLTIAERTAQAKDLPILDQTYDSLADATLGQFGARAVHYRAARHFESRSRPSEALSHAIAAFEAVPAEGVAFVLMARLADRIGSSEEMVQSLERVAARSPTPEERSEWLSRAAAMADSSVAGRRQRVDVLLRAVAVRADAPTLEPLGAAIAQLLEVAPDEHDVVVLRFERALKSLLPKVGGSAGALFSVHAARIAYSILRHDDLGLRSLRRATECDGGLEAFSLLRENVPDIIRSGDAARAWVKDCVERSDQRFAGVGRQLAELAAAVAEGLGETPAAARLIVKAAQEAPDDAALVERARHAARAVSDPDLLTIVEELLPMEERVRRILDEANSAPVSRALDLLLGIEFDALPEELRNEALAALATRQEEIGRLDDARSTWQLLSELSPTSGAALRGLERSAEARGDFEELARLLQKRVEATADPHELRSLRLRRAALLDEKLGRGVAAREELEKQLSEGGDHLEVLRALAEFTTRAGDRTRAADLYLRASEVAASADESSSLAMLAAESFSEAGDLDRARRVIAGAASKAPTERLLELRVAIERRAKDSARLVDALSGLAGAPTTAPQRAASLLLEAARAADHAKMRERAAALARAAADKLPESAGAQLLAARLEYIHGGAGDAERAKRTVAALRGVEERLSNKDAELRAFLLAEALDVAVGGGAGLRELKRAVHDLGRRPLIAVGLAERLEDQPSKALELLDAALGSDLRGLRGEGQVLIRAGSVARGLGELDRAQAYFSAVPSHDPRQPEAAAQLAEIAEERRRLESEALAEQQRRQEKAREAEKQRLAEKRAAEERALAETRAAKQRAAEERATEERAAKQRAAEQRLEDERRRGEDAERERRRERELAEAELREAQVREAREREQRAQPEERESPPPSPSASLLGAQSPVPPRPSSRPSQRPSMMNSLELGLMGQLEQGDINAGRQLLMMLDADASRNQDRLLVAGRMVALQPGDGWALEQLVRAAEADRNEPLSLAVRHVVGAYGGAPRVQPPAWDRLHEQPDAVRRLLLRDVPGGLQGAEAVAVVWENAPHAFKREPSTYGITGLERVAQNAPTELGRMYGEGARLLGLGRTPLFQRRGDGPITLDVALIVPPALLLSGEIDEIGPDLAFHFGAMLLATAPEFALLFGAEPARVRTLLSSLAVAFGPPHSSRPDANTTHLASLLWETVSPRGQRRLSQLCADPSVLRPDRVFASAQQVLRRAGLFFCGDVGMVVEVLCEEEQLEIPQSLSQLARCCEASPAIADLVRLAVLPEYAEVRWNAR